MKVQKGIRIGIIQRVLPSYRVPFFDALADAFHGNVSVFAGEARNNEAINESHTLLSAKYRRAENHHFFKGKYYLCWQSGLLKWLSDWQPQVLIIEANLRYLHLPSAIHWIHKNSGRVIGWGLGFPHTEGMSSFLWKGLRKRFIKKFDALITYSSQGAKEYIASGYPKEHIYIAPNAVAPRPTHRIPKRLQNYRGDQPVIVFVGRLQKRKRIDTLIRACASLKGNIQPLLWIIGDGPQRNALESLASEIYPLTEFYGAQHGTDLEHHLRLADLFVLPGTGGLAVQEAMSYGLPVIVGVSDGTQDDLVRMENGWQLADTSVDTLRKTITEALGDIRVLRNKGKASYKIVDKEINLENMVSVFSEAVEKVLEN